MRRYKRLVIATGCLLMGACLTVKAQKTETKTLVIAGYPDSAEWLMTDVLQRVGDVYEKENPDVRVKIRPHISYRLARKLVLSGKAAGMMISEKMNRFRAYASQTGGERGFNDLKLKLFLPIATRVIRSESEVLARMRLGIASNRISDRLSDFLDFLSSDAAKEAVSQIKDVEITPPGPTPARDRKGLKRGGPVKLDEPILAY